MISVTNPPLTGFSFQRESLLEESYLTTPLSNIYVLRNSLQTPFTVYFDKINRFIKTFKWF